MLCQIFLLAALAMTMSLGLTVPSDQTARHQNELGDAANGPVGAEAEALQLSDKDFLQFNDTENGPIGSEAEAVELTDNDLLGDDDAAQLNDKRQNLVPIRDPLMIFYHGLFYSNKLGYEYEGDATRQHVCLRTKQVSARSLKFVHDGSWQCIAYDRHGCDESKPKWPFYVLDNKKGINEKGFKDLRDVGWDRRIMSYKCFAL